MYAIQYLQGWTKALEREVGSKEGGNINVYLGLVAAEDQQNNV